MKEFSKWTIEEVEDTFQLSESEQSQWLDDWQAAGSVAFAPGEEERLVELGERLRRHVLDWNEEELKIYCIGPLLNLVDYLHETYQAFFERRLSATIDHERLGGIVDCIIARGKRSPKRPYFCLHEYKPERHSANDPLGWVAVAMVAVQHVNNDGKPIYGAYVVGRQWFFLVLHETSYALSLAYDATKLNDLRQIFGMLKYIKHMIEAELNGGGEKT